MTHPGAERRLLREVGEVLLGSDVEPEVSRRPEPTMSPRSTLSAQLLIPMRYQVRENGGERFLTCAESSNIGVRIERGLSVGASAARKYPEHTIFLDGVVAAEPFLDTGRKLYNLDHHEGCVRSFTLAACEQATVLVLRGLDLSGERWTVLANEPDLDTVLAIWVLLNHRRLVGDEGREVRRRVMPLIRLQGAIDAHGFELAGLTGFPEDLQQSAAARIDELREPEVELKRQGRWDEVDLLEHTAAVLFAVDQMVYTPGDFEGLEEVEELDRVPIGADRFAVICRSGLGIYELEVYLKRVHDDRLGLIILERAERAYTVRQVDPFLPTPLDALFERLNLVDPAVRGDNRWGGSNDIGGSPRNGGTALDPRQISAVCRWVYRPPSLGARVIRALAAVTLSALTLAVAALAVAWNADVGGLDFGRLHRPESVLRFPLLLSILVTAVLLVATRRRAPRILGLRRPRWDRWVWWTPVALLAAAAGGSLAPLWEGAGPPPFAGSSIGFGLALVLGAYACEVLFRGLVHGLVVEVSPVMVPGGRRYPSLPLAVSVVASAAATLLLGRPGHDLIVSGALPDAAWIVASVLLGLVCGIARERSGSVWAAVAMHVLAVLAAWFGLVFGS